MGTIVEISRDGLHPLDHDEAMPLARGMAFDYKKFHFGRAAKERGNVEVTPVRLHEFDPGGRLLCGAGYLDRIWTYFRRGDYEVDYVDETDLPPARLQARQPRWGRLDRVADFAAREGDRLRLEARLAADGAIDPTDANGVALARRVRQREALEAIARRVDRGLGGVIQAPPGFGKSRLMCALCRLYPAARIVFAVPGIDLFHKTRAALLNYVPEVGQVGDGRNRVTRVTVCSIDSLHRVDDCDLLVVDEVHEAMAPRAAAALAVVAPRAVRLGLTATPEGRLDGGDAQLEALVGPIIYRMTWPEAVRHGMVVPITVEWLSMVGLGNPGAGLAGPNRKRAGLWEHRDRNRRFARRLLRCPDDEQTLAMVETIAHAIHLGRELPGYRLCYGTHDVEAFAGYRDAGYIDDTFVPVDRAVRDEMRRDFEAGTLKKVIATDVWTTGVSFDALPVIARLDGRSSPIIDEQLPGRVSRVHTPSGKMTGRLIDSLDEFDEGFATAARRRYDNYVEKEWTQCLPATTSGPAGRRQRPPR